MSRVDGWFCYVLFFFQAWLLSTLDAIGLSRQYKSAWSSSPVYITFCLFPNPWLIISTALSGREKIFAFMPFNPTSLLTLMSPPTGLSFITIDE